MDILALSNVSSHYIQAEATKGQSRADSSFQSIFQTAVNMLNETNDLQNAADSAMIQFALGDSDNTHDLRIAQSKANIALQYTVAVKDKALEAYREIINMQI